MLWRRVTIKKTFGLLFQPWDLGLLRGTEVEQIYVSSSGPKEGSWSEIDKFCLFFTTTPWGQPNGEHYIYLLFWKSFYFSPFWSNEKRRREFLLQQNAFCPQWCKSNSSKKDHGSFSDWFWKIGNANSGSLEAFYSLKKNYARVTSIKNIFSIFQILLQGLENYNESVDSSIDYTSSGFWYDKFLVSFSNKTIKNDIEAFWVIELYKVVFMLYLLHTPVALVHVSFVPVLFM